MAKLAIGPIILITLSCLFTVMASGGKHSIEDEESSWYHHMSKTEKFVKIHFYLQDVLAGPNATVYEVARASITANSSTSFGQVRVLDDLMTAGHSPNSAKLGRAQGVITFSDLEISALTMNLNFVFSSGEYKGSTICIIGRNQIMDKQRELVVAGGTGVFRFARGYALSSTYSYDVETSYGVLEYTIYITYNPNIRLHDDI